MWLATCHEGEKMTRIVNMGTIAFACIVQSIWNRDGAVMPDANTIRVAVRRRRP
jgi:hypothetical protein